ncbi:LysR family transcriptional regulator [Pseudomonas sp. No.21]|uniref:LysR family transcriptional regulator n=1 Tax=Pseudomonas TaxID=286 RepID=UPI000DA935EB|nr:MULTISPECIES: LysR family transcriptional regulator [Pseudomonas]MDW3711316.1 LysR family transcriptional regulator [Pseudomonas sp. 2023EL-01195]PZE11380.1 LysR family transcriptional regulator [Pseudomonas sp. 57B-090624]GJN49300.1 LysR family transcriptional regulator [Pseudomonas tohonis]
MDKLLALKMFVAAVDAKGFSAAARGLGLATSSVTRMVDALEQELGTVLLNRSTRQVTVTEAGAAYYQSARQVLEYLAEADASVMDGGEEPSGPLRVSVPTAFGRRMISPHIGGLLARHPRLELDITLTDEIVDLLGERVDLSIRLGAAAPMDGVVARTLGEFRRHVVASPAYLAERGTPAQPLELAEHDCLRFNYGAARQVWTFQGPEGEVRVPVRGRLRSNNIEVLREVALAGSAVALLPDWLVDDDIAAGRLLSLFPGQRINADDTRSLITALYLPSHRASRRVAAFIAFVGGLL